MKSAIFSAALLFSCLTSGSSAAQWPDLSKPVPAVIGGGPDAAVVVGASYIYVPSVPGAVDNAQDWYVYFTKSLGIAPDRVALLRNNEATLEKMRKFALRAAEQVGQGGTLWFVFIGHGAPARDGNDGILVGADVQQDADSLYARSLPGKELLEILEKGRQDKTVVLIDACFSGRTGEGKPLVEGLQPLIVHKSGPVLSGRTVVLTAAKGDQFAGPLPGANRPAFSYLALGALRGWAGQGQVTAGAVADYARVALGALIKDRNQTPDIIGNPGLTLPAGREQGPDLADMTLARAASGGDLAFEATALSPVPKAEKPGLLDPSLAVDAEWRKVDVASMEKLENAMDKDKRDSVPVEEKIRSWTQLAADIPLYREMAERRAAQWRDYHARQLAAEQAGKERHAARDRDWARLGRLLPLKVVSMEDKRKYALAFVKAYGKNVEDNPYLPELLSYLPDGLLTPSEISAAHAAAMTGDAALAKVTDVGDMVSVPAGYFNMGAAKAVDSDKEQPRHKVYLDGYKMDKYEVTVQQYRKFAEATGRVMAEQPAYSADNHPVVYVEWRDAAAYCKWAGKRLPTEAEWERAARGGTDYRWSFGKEEGKLGEYAWYNGNAKDMTHPVGRKKPNQYGLYDMEGNVWEWLADWYDEDYYRNSPGKNPSGPGTGSFRGLRGGSWGNDSSSTCPGFRSRSAPDYCNISYGFRCAADAR